MKSETNILFMARAAALLLAMMLTTTAAWAQTQYISEVMLIGKNNKTEAYALRDHYVDLGWTAIDQDLNAGCGSKSDYIFLLYKTRTTASPNHTFITAFCISDASGDAPENLTYEGHRYKLVPFDGDNHFKEKKGDLNSNAGGKDIHLYYTTDRMAANKAVSFIYFNKTKSGAVQGYDLNNGAGGYYIYMHCESSDAPSWIIDKNNDGVRCIVKDYDGTEKVKRSEVLAFPAIIDGAVVVSISTGFDFSDFEGLETIYFSQAYNANKMPAANGLLMRASDGRVMLKHVHLVDNSGVVVKTDELPASITSIAANGFMNTSIETLKMPNVTGIGEYAFTGCGALTSVTMPNVTSIDEFAFYSCKALTTVTMPSVTSIGTYAFQFCNALSSISLPSSLTTIGKFAFDSCPNLTSVTINGNPTMGEDAIPDGASLVLKVGTNVGDDANWLTFYNDRYNFKASSWTTVYKATVAEGKVCLTEVKDKIVNAGTAVVLKTGPSNGFAQLNRTTNTSSDTQPNDMKGVNARTYIPDMLAGDYAGCTFYVLSNKDGVAFYRYSGDRMPQNKAFIALPPSAGAREVLTLSDGETTAIEAIDHPQRDASAWYTLDGRRLSGKPAQKGIYVHQGRKEVVR